MVALLRFCAGEQRFSIPVQETDDDQVLINYIQGTSAALASAERDAARLRKASQAIIDAYKIEPWAMGLEKDAWFELQSAINKEVS